MNHCRVSCAFRYVAGLTAAITKAMEKEGRKEGRGRVTGIIKRGKIRRRLL